MNPLVFRILLLFCIAQAIGIFTGAILVTEVRDNPLVQPFVSYGTVQDPLNAVLFFGYALAGAIVIVLVIRYVKNPIFFTLLELGLVAAASSIVFYSLLRLWLPYAESMALGVLLGLGLGISKQFYHQLKNVAAVLASAGVGALFGVSLGLVPALVFLVLLSVYDYIAVFKTRHMVEIADYVIKKDLAFTVTSRTYVPQLKRESRIDLGTGDMIMPIVVGTALLPVSPAATALAIAGATIALGVFLVYVMGKRVIMPALPPIAFGMLSFLAAGKLLGLF